MSVSSFVTSFSQQEASSAAAVTTAPSQPAAIRVDHNDDELRARIAQLERELNDMRARVVTAEDEARISRDELSARRLEVDALRGQVTERDDRIEKLSQTVVVKVRITRTVLEAVTRSIDVTMFFLKQLGFVCSNLCCVVHLNPKSSFLKLHGAHTCPGKVKQHSFSLFI